MNYKEFFTTDNKSGYKTREGLLQKKNPEIYNKLIEFTIGTELELLPFKEKVWYFINNIKEKKKCCGCGGEVKFKGDLTKGYRDYCSLTCANNNGNLLERQKKSMLDKHGVEFYPQHSTFIDKQKKTKKERYGDENYNNILKGQETKQILYSNKNYNNPEGNSETCIIKYGVKNIFQLDSIKEKSKNTNLKNLGVEYSLQSDFIKNKIKNNYADKLKAKYSFIKRIEQNLVYCDCETCNNEYVIPRVLLNERNRLGYGLCTNCNPIGSNNKSSYEDILIDYIIFLKPGISVIRNSRNVLDSKELDIYLPEYNLAIEINGVYWHSELFKNNTYHLDKTNECELKGIKLIHIFEDEWLEKESIVKSRIKNILGVNEDKIFGRKCEIREVLLKDSKTFLDNNHIQGSINSKIRIGLYYNDKLVSLMTFGQGRIIMGGKKEEYELTRFCNNTGTSVIGGASKLLKYFIKIYKPSTIISYADRRWSQGGLYDELGFEFIHDSNPNYWYVFNYQRKYRFNYRKSELIKQGFDSSKSEHEIMLERKIYRIYDCGNKRYELKL